MLGRCSKPWSPESLLGAFVAAQVGPVSLLCIRTATRSGFGPAAAIGAGAATVDVVYAALGVLGAAALIQLEPVGLALGVRGDRRAGVDGRPHAA